MVVVQVNGCDLRNATHDQAVVVIRNATNPIRFLVQSLSTPPGVSNVSSVQILVSGTVAFLVAESKFKLLTIWYLFIYLFYLFIKYSHNETSMINERNSKAALTVAHIMKSYVLQ